MKNNEFLNIDVIYSIEIIIEECLYRVNNLDKKQSKYVYQCLKYLITYIYIFSYRKFTYFHYLVIQVEELIILQDQMTF